MVVVHVHYEKKKPTKKSAPKKTTAKKSVAKPKVVNEYGVKVGDIWYQSWGYEQTNTDFYQVVGITAKTVKFREIEYKLTIKGELNMHGDVMPIKGKFTKNSKPFAKRVSVVHGRLIANAPHGSYSYLHPWDGKPQFKSWYA